MCRTCGCASDDDTTLINLQTGRRVTLVQQEHVHADGTRHRHPVHHGDPAHSHDHRHPHNGARDHRLEVIELNSRILEKNADAAMRNRAWLESRGILALNLMSAPGAGKTTLLERTISELKKHHVIFVLEGDQASDRDGARIKASGAPAVQINTGQGCHLDAEMTARGLAELEPSDGAVLFIENVGNLVCPALFDLGEAKRVAILSVTEGDDKPLKYPHMFRAADLMLLNKIDLLPHVRFDVERAIHFARRANPAVEVLQLSGETGAGLDGWLAWIAAARAGVSGVRDRDR
jgi:hydrogenase nickel incorporation protein HypB